MPTWNFIVAHLSGVPELLDHEENFEVLTRLVDNFEDRVAAPRPLYGTPEDAETPAGTAAARSACAWSRRGSWPSER